MSEIVRKVVCPLTTREIVNKLVMFIETLGDLPLYTYQSLFAQRVCESLLDCDGAIITGLWARQCGKTQVVADTCRGLAIILPALANEFYDDIRLNPFQKGFMAGIYAPIQEQSEISFDRIRTGVMSEHGVEVMSDPELDVDLVTKRSDTLTFSNGSMLIARTASPDSQIEGKTFHLVICEEAQKLSRAKVEKEIRPMLASTNGTMVKIGTAWESRGGFHQSIQQNEEEWKNGGKRNHFQIPYDVVISEKRRAFEKDGKQAHLNYEKFVEKEKMLSGGETSIEFRMNFMCLWHESRVIAVREAVFLAASRKDLERGIHYHWHTQVAGLDIGKTNDSTVLTLMGVDRSRPIRNIFQMADSNEDKQFYYRKTILDWQEFRGSFEGELGQYRALVEYLLRTHVSAICIDATGIGDPVFERIEAMIGGQIMCIPYKFSSLSKSHLYKYYLSELHAGRIDYAGGVETRRSIEYRKFQQEHQDLDKVEASGYATYQAPEGGHDDYPDSGALAAWAEKMLDSVIMPDISVSTAPEGGAFGRRGYKGSSFMGQAVEDRGDGMQDLGATNAGRSSRYRR